MRYNVQVDVRELLPGNQVLTPITLGYGGISSWVTRTYPLGTLVFMQIDLKDGSAPFSTPARVIRVDQSDGVPVMALRFMMPQMQLESYFEKTFGTND